MDVPVYLLESKHDRSQFDCGEPELNAFIKQYATQNARNSLSKTHVWVKNDAVAGFYTLSMGEISPENMPANLAKKLPRYPVAIARIARLAIDKNHQGNGNGRALLLHALENCHRLSNTIGMYAVLVDAKHQQAKAFYLRNDFQPLPDHELTLFITTQTLKQLFSH
ncbi:GNAT family N-acetyltransferase [Candidatus Thiothrix sp. Deng01]|uniref:GNAT family N-acetyltransferase n=1 Tax=Candidatus Thiothrix phosphatis TaxID=3112415 RepID=A0ABU6CTG5_9GAMM|nr:GNAT family N-acetyltransferase [Candidatus Thiothrix sp. Deng01]MEB4590115.1 GNAT family N-acetyltransferase [Candidatus Thiothrix sp. Deng01]